MVLPFGLAAAPLATAGAIMRTLYDSKCYELAQHFFPTASHNQLDELAQRFQECVEDFCDPENPEQPRSAESESDG